MEIGKKLKERRLQLGLTMREVAEKSDVSEATVSRWESGDIANMRRNKIVQLANALQVSPSFIMGWEDIQNVSKCIAERIKEFRELKNISQIELAESANVSHELIVLLEQGKTDARLSSLDKIASVLNVDIAFLLGETSIPNKAVLAEQDEGHILYDKLDTEDKAEIRGEMKQMLKADKYSNADKEAERKAAAKSIHDRLDIAAFGGGVKHTTKKDRETT